MCKRTGIILLLLILAWAAVPQAQEDVRISIQEIQQDEFIKGTVTGLTAAGISAYKVVVYVKTDQWYIHPYADSGEGQSWTSVTPEGTWNLPTVLREHPASQVAALLVARGAKMPSKTENVQGITHRAIVVRTLTGTADDGKL